jgi:hypothetical protein
MAPFGYGVAGVVGFVAVAQIITHVVLKRSPSVPSLLGLWALGAITVAAAVLLNEREQPIVFAATNLAIYLFIIEVYLFVYAAALGSLSIRVVVRTLELEPTADAFERAITECSPATFFDIRLRSLLAQRLLVETHGRYRITQAGKRWAQLGAVLKRVLGVGIGG